jgi:hypothetical protein
MRGVFLGVVNLCFCLVIGLRLVRLCRFIILDRLFGGCLGLRDDLGILPLRTHLEPDFAGFMLLMFISLVVSCGVRVRLGQGVCIGYTMLLFWNLNCRVWNETVFVRLLKSRNFYLKLLML